MEEVTALIDKTFWKGKKVFITGHNGFKGAWLCLWLHSLGADVIGYSPHPPTNPSLFELCGLDSLVPTIIGDVRSKEKLQEAVMNAKPDIVIHMAAQPLVRSSYEKPVETYEINVMGTVNLLEAVRIAVHNGIPVRAVLNVTSDKCYENKEWVWGYREGDALGGYDPYSNSKACSELVTTCYRNSFFHPNHYDVHGVALASARSGNVIGGGDWAADRLIPDVIRALLSGTKLTIRNPGAIRPWQHVLEPLGGYLLLAQKLCEDGRRFSQSWNFGPSDYDAKPVEWIVRKLCDTWGGNAAYEIEPDGHWHEAHYLKLDCSKARSELGWQPKWNLDQALDRIIEWTRAYQQHQNLRSVCLQQIEQYCATD
ncbi:CDP-glucose 4,6-dehydratase [Brevibacillus thermoruber]|uniref:CDP-glucose 4,6-dehydratase n=1 Tax=Brevibacillus thermoruber TaxID=33942 RepID=A0A9X3Z5L3_9BACL|nr:CDP-glucose 4,6-dehydratase [Brevibacillus thermoruber]MDA5110854.1 CDP-glucose 4,6-dehydratase [Brevibacillus thermoruber]